MQHREAMRAERKDAVKFKASHSLALYSSSVLVVSLLQCLGQQLGVVHHLILRVAKQSLYLDGKVRSLRLNQLDHSAAHNVKDLARQLAQLEDSAVLELDDVVDRAKCCRLHGLCRLKVEEETNMKKMMMKEKQIRKKW